MADIGMALIVVAHIVVAHIVMAHIAMVHIAMAYIVMAPWSIEPTLDQSIAACVIVQHRPRCARRDGGVQPLLHNARHIPR